jgi:hypothetical protein
VARELWHERTGILANFRIFLGIFVNFWSVCSGLGTNRNYVLETVGPAATHPSAQGPRSTRSGGARKICWI